MGGMVGQWLGASVNPGGSPLFPAVIEGILWG
jgi:hypothetical protein